MLDSRILNQLEFCSNAEREHYLVQLASFGDIEACEIRSYLKELHRMDIENFRLEDSRHITFKMEDFIEKKPKNGTTKECPHCHGIGHRHVATSTSWCQGNYRRADGSYHMEKDGCECTTKYKWSICPDCHGSGTVTYKNGEWV